MTLLTFKDKYVVASATAVTTTSTTLVDDTQASQTFDLAASQVVLVIYQANNVNGAAMPATGMQNAISVDGVDKANSWDSPGAANYPTRNCVFWLGILASGSHTIKGRFAVITSGTATISNRVLLIYIFDGDEFQYVDDATTATAPSTTMIDDPNAQVTFTPSNACKALLLYNAANSGAAETGYGKKVAINVGGTDYGQGEKGAGALNYCDSTFTVHALNLTAVSTTVKGRFALATYTGSVTIHRRQLAVLLLADSTLLDIITSTTQVNTTSSSLVDDAQATINRTTTDTRELLGIAMGTKRGGTTSTIYGECYGIKINANDRANSRGSPSVNNRADSAATAYAEQLAAGSQTVQGRFSTNYTTNTAVIDARKVVALWFSIEVAPTYVNVSDSGVGADALYDLSATFTVADSGGSSDVAGMEAGLPLSDSGVGADTLYSIELSLADVGSGVDVLALQGQLILTDTGLGSESLNLDTGTVGTSTSNAATRECTQRKAFCANGKFWVFYSDGTNMVYKTSANGLSWSPETIVRSALAGYMFAVFFDGTYVHYVYQTGYYRGGTPNADGTITWIADEQAIGTGCQWPVLSVDSSGYVWLGFSKVVNFNPCPFITKSGNNDGTWGTTPPGFPYQLSSIESSTWDIVPISLTNNKMVIFYGRNANTVKAKPWDGSAWGTEVATTSTLGWGGEHSAVPEGDTAHVVFLKYATYDIIYVKYTYSSNSFGTETTLQEAATSSSAPVISIDAAINDLYVFWAGYPTANHFYYRKYTASTSTWETAVDWITETALVSNGYHNCFYRDYESEIGLAYTTGAASPYNVRFRYLTLSNVIYVNVSDSGAGADALYDLLVTLTLAESGGGIDDLGMQADLPLSDSGVGSDDLQSIGLPLADSGSGVEELTMQGQLSLLDVGAGLDSPLTQGQISLSDAGSGADAGSLEGQLTLDDSGVGADFPSVLGQLSLADSGLGTEYVSAGFWMEISDSGIGSDVLSLLGQISPSDVGSGIETSSLQAQLPLTDSAVGDDILQSIGLPLSDLGVGLDTLTMEGQLPFADVGNGVDLSSLLAQLPLADSAVGSDVLSQLEAALSLADSGSGVDVASTGLSVELSDSGVGSDLASLQTQLSLADSGNGADLASLLAQLSLADSAIGSDLLSLLTQVLLSDSGLGTESIDISIAEIIKEFIDSGLGVDIVSLLAQLLLADSGNGVDLASLTAQLSLSDSGVGADSAVASFFLTVSDSGSGVDSVSQLQARLSLADLGVGSEGFQLQGSFTVSDSGLGIDIVYALQQIIARAVTLQGNKGAVILKGNTGNVVLKS